MQLKQLVLNRPSWLGGSDGKGERVILASHLSLTRNIEKFPFPRTASVLEKKMAFEEILRVLTEQGHLDTDPLQVNLQEISEVGKTLLFERDYITVDMIRSGGDRGLVALHDGPVLILNGENHLTFRFECSQKDMFDQWKKLDTLDTELGKELTYAFDEKRGFLQSSAMDAGTGLSVEHTLHLPGLVLTETIDQVLAGATQLGLVAEGKFRDGVESWGALFTFRAGAFSGTTEEEIITASLSAIEEICTRELQARDRLFSEAPREMEDRIWRSWGILRYARLLSISQLLNLTSMLRLGIERGVLDEQLSMDNLNGIISAALQGSVALLMTEVSKEADEFDLIRAETVRTLME